MGVVTVGVAISIDKYVGENFRSWWLVMAEPFSEVVSQSECLGAWVHMATVNATGKMLKASRMGGCDEWRAN